MILKSSRQIVFYQDERSFIFSKLCNKTLPSSGNLELWWKAKAHFVTIRSARGKKTSTAYEDVRLKPKTKLAEECLSDYTEDLYISTLESISSARNTALVNDGDLDSPSSSQSAKNMDEAPVPSTLLTKLDDVDIESSNQIIRHDERDIGELPESV